MNSICDCFLQRPDYQLCQSTALQILREHANSLSTQGKYNTATLWIYRKIWQRSKQPTDYLAYLVFRRALGYPLTELKAYLLQQRTRWPVRWVHKIYRLRWQQCCNLLAEYRVYAQQEPQGLVPPLLLHRRNNQPLWRAQLAEYLNSADTIYSVGNSPKLNNSGLGQDIDTATCVVRFNQYQAEHIRSTDTGQKCTIWVLAPGFRSQLNPACDWLILTGPDMLWWQLNWSHLDYLAEKKLISVPLIFWRHLVRHLAAPPSAGLLTHVFLRAMVNNKNKFQLAGFGYNPQVEQQYHLAQPEHQAVSRHNWLAEHTYFQQWSGE